MLVLTFAECGFVPGDVVALSVSPFSSCSGFGSFECSGIRFRRVLFNMGG